MQLSMPVTNIRSFVMQRLWLVPLVYLVCVGAYFVVRYDGRWSESDSAAFAKYHRAVAAEAQLLTTESEPYPNGYGFQAITLFITTATGLDIATLHQWVYPLLAGVVAIPAWALYRELSGSARGATIATMLLLLQPEFLFVVLRSSHEKFTRTLMLVCLLLLCRSFRLRDRPGLFAVHVALFYATAYAFIATNNLLAHSFIFAVGVALVLGWLLQHWNKTLRMHSGHVLQRLPYAVVVCLGLVYLFTFYAYPPAQHDLLVMQNLWDRLAALLLDVQAESTNAYTQVASGWISLPVYFAVSLANWLVLLASVALWMRQTWAWVVRRHTPPNTNAWLLWLLYTSFAVQGVLSVLVDASGALGSNIQHRLFPSFSIIAVAMVGSTIARWQPRRYAVPMRAVLAGSMALIAVLTMFKATNEPALSNKWMFYHDPEAQALLWGDQHLRDDELWTDLDERMAVAFTTVNGSSERGNRLYATELNPTTRVLLISDITRLRSVRLETPLPLPPDAQRVYDNGEAQLFRLRARTPFQR